MNSRIWFVVALVCALAVVLTNLPFIPGPSILYLPAQIFYSAGTLLSILGLLLVPIGIVWTVREFRKSVEPRLVKAFAILCWALPIISFVSMVWVSEQTREMSRNIAIANASTIVEQVDRYYMENGKYPDEMNDLVMTVPSSNIIGVPAYFYTRTDKAYTVSFTQNVLFNFNFEVVLYDPTNSQKAEGELDTLYNTGRKNWKYYIYD